MQLSFVSFRESSQLKNQLATHLREQEEWKAAEASEEERKAVGEAAKTSKRAKSGHLESDMPGMQTAIFPHRTNKARWLARQARQRERGGGVRGSGGRRGGRGGGETLHVVQHYHFKF